MFPLILTVLIGMIVGDAIILLRIVGIRGEHPKPNATNLQLHVQSLGCTQPRSVFVNSRALLRCFALCPRALERLTHDGQTSDTLLALDPQGKFETRKASSANASVTS